MQSVYLPPEAGSNIGSKSAKRTRQIHGEGYPPSLSETPEPESARTDAAGGTPGTATGFRRCFFDAPTSPAGFRRHFFRSDFFRRHFFFDFFRRRFDPAFFDFFG